LARLATETATLDMSSAAHSIVGQLHGWSHRAVNKALTVLGCHLHELGPTRPSASPSEICLSVSRTGIGHGKVAHSRTEEKPMQDFDFDGFFNGIDTLDDGMQERDDYTDGFQPFDPDQRNGAEG